MNMEIEHSQLPTPPDIHLEEPRWETIRDVNKHRAILGAGAVAIEMQLAHPFVAQAIEDAGYFTNNPLQRLRETAKAGMDLIFGDPEAARAVALRVQGMHMKVDSYPTDERVLREDLPPHYKKGDPYSANDQGAQKWVAASIVYASFKGYEAFVGPLSSRQKQDYLSQAQELFATMGFHEPLPETGDELNIYINDMIETKRVIVSKAARKLSPQVLTPSKIPGAEVAASYLKLTTLALLPNSIREQFKLQKLTPGQRKAFELTANGFQKVLPHMPEIVRLNPQARAVAKRNPEAI